MRGPPKKKPTHLSGFLFIQELPEWFKVEVYNQLKV